MKKTFIIDGNNFSDLGGFYDEVVRKLAKGMEGKFGRSLDAVNDLLRGGFGRFERGEPVAIIWKHAAKSQKDLGHAQAVEYLSGVLARCHPQNKKRVVRKLKDAQAGSGPTMFDMLVGIFTSHPHITFSIEK